MKTIVLVGLLGTAALLTSGCADACERAANRLEDRLRECGLKVEEGQSDDNRECTESAATTAEKLAECAERATCDSVKTGAWITTCND